MLRELLKCNENMPVKMSIARNGCSCCEDSWPIEEDIDTFKIKIYSLNDVLVACISNHNDDAKFYDLFPDYNNSDDTPLPLPEKIQLEEIE